MKKICVITATRAEYGLLYPLLKKIDEHPALELQLIVSGTHLSSAFGHTKDEIVQDGFLISKEIEILNEENDACAVSKSMGTAIIKFAEFLKADRPDIAVILGDRYEMMAFAIALVNEKIPIAHLNGGETTEGILDEIYRHCITKMSYLHFTNCEVHRKRVIQLGEDPRRVFNVGDICIENIMNEKLLSREEMETDLQISLKQDNIMVITYHPVTMENDSLEQLKCLVRVLEKYADYYLIFTKANSDSGGESINHYLTDFVKRCKNATVVDSLGRVRFLSLLQYTTVMIGNSSSGIYEAPVFHIPTVNIGNRQKGRLHGDTVIDCKTSTADIERAINLALNEEFRCKCKHSRNIFGDGHTSEHILKALIEFHPNQRQNYKRFHDLQDNFV